MLYISKPRYVPRIWGSLTSPDDDIRIGEIWWIWNEGGSSSGLISMSGGDPVTLNSLLEADKLLFEGVYPVLLKTLHTADRLSVQVHPGLNGGTLRKEETWIVLSAEKDSWMMGGLLVTGADELLDLLRQNRTEEALVHLDLREGDVYHLPPGTVHALGPGLEILEVQSNCNVTYRLHDWGRTDADGVPRDLHLEKGIEAVDWSSAGKPVPAGTYGRIDQSKLTADYRITDVSGDLQMNVPGGALIYISSGAAEVQGRIIESPACLIADIDGGRLRLNGSAYLIESGGE